MQISKWFKEEETAAKRGRPIFGEMLRLLREQQADGLVIHKIDRSARNLKDWSELGELIDEGIDVRFVNEGLDLNSRGGRLSADIQAVVAADYIRNLREETIKGFYGRLKQGFLPMPAPIGYLDCGAGKPKEIDPVRGPLVKQAFTLYTTCRFSHETLADKMFQLGLRTKSGKRLTATRWSAILNNPFYSGSILIKKTGTLYPGAHKPLVSQETLHRVKDIMSAKYHSGPQKHDFLFRRLFKYDSCQYTLIPELHKGHVYYRCQTKDCPMTSVREEAIAAKVKQCLQRLRLSEHEREYFSSKLDELKAHWGEEEQKIATATQLKLTELDARQNRLIDTYVDGHLDPASFSKRKTALELERQALTTQLEALETHRDNIPAKIEEFLELAHEAYFLYESSILVEKREMLRRITSNRSVRQKTPVITLDSAFQILADRSKYQNGGPLRSIHRTWKALIGVFISSAAMPLDAAA